MAREGRNTGTDYLEGWDPTLTCWQLLRRITEGLASNTMLLSLLLDRARPMTWCDVDPMAITPISSRPARREPTCAGFSPAKLHAHHTRSEPERVITAAAAAAASLAASVVVAVAVAPHWQSTGALGRWAHSQGEA
jgi:hypothetical protein